MALRSLWVWQLDDEGNPKLDQNGERIPHRKMNTAKTYKELSPAEKRSFDDQLHHYDMHEQARAANVLGELKDVLAVLGQASK